MTLLSGSWPYCQSDRPPEAEAKSDPVRERKLKALVKAKATRTRHRDEDVRAMAEAHVRNALAYDGDPQVALSLLTANPAYRKAVRRQVAVEAAEQLLRFLRRL